MTIRNLPALLGLLTAFLLNSPVAAQEAPPTANASPFARAAVDSSTLETYRGGSLQVRNDMVLAGTTADNTAHHVNTGNNAISAGAFSNMNGIPLVIQNSGANVLIQNAVIVNLQMN